MNECKNTIELYATQLLYMKIQTQGQSRRLPTQHTGYIYVDFD